jgi:hypothetical protein
MTDHTTTALDPTVEERPFRAASSGKNRNWASAPAGAAITILLCIANAVGAHAQITCDTVPELNNQQFLSQPCWQTAEVSGNVLGADLTKGLIRVSLSALSFNKSFDADVDFSGRFQVNSVPAGDYELFAFQRGRVLGITEVSVSPSASQVVFQLSKDQQPLQPWPQLRGPHCVRSKCYVDVTDDLRK